MAWISGSHAKTIRLPGDSGGAAPVAAMLALRFVGNADKRVP
jgi:hypothetical protein